MQSGIDHDRRPVRPISGRLSLLKTAGRLCLFAVAALLVVMYARPSMRARRAHGMVPSPAPVAGELRRSARPAAMVEPKRAPGVQGPRRSLKRPSAGTAGVPAAATEHLRDDPDDDEDDVMFAHDVTPEQRVWRYDFQNESEDAAWTERMQHELDGRAAASIKGGYDITDLSCRETVCRAILKFDTHVDAAAFQHAQHPSTFRYVYQSLSPTVPNGGSEEWGYSYELLVTRPDGDPAAAPAG